VCGTRAIGRKGWEVCGRAQQCGSSRAGVNEDEGHKRALSCGAVHSEGEERTMEYEGGRRPLAHVAGGEASRCATA